ncbi:MAG: hypothetical protein AAGI38_14515 [Bacteroidota bacterium]
MNCLLQRSNWLLACFFSLLISFSSALGQNGQYTSDSYSGRAFTGDYRYVTTASDGEVYEIRVDRNMNRVRVISTGSRQYRDWGTAVLRKVGTRGNAYEAVFTYQQQEFVKEKRIQIYLPNGDGDIWVSSTTTYTDGNKKNVPAKRFNMSNTNYPNDYLNTGGVGIATH